MTEPERDEMPPSSHPSPPRGEGEVEGSATESLQAELAAAQDKHLRAAAELDNYRKLVIREKADLMRSTQEGVLRALLPVVDSLERALRVTGEGDQFARAVLEGVELTNRQFHDALKRLGVVPIESRGRVFDPSFHQAVARVESDEYDENVVVEELQRGYLFHDRVLRPAMVSVAAKTRVADTPAEPAAPRPEEGRAHG